MDHRESSKPQNQTSSEAKPNAKPTGAVRVVSLQEALKLDPKTTFKVVPVVNRSTQNPNVSIGAEAEITPEEDARLPILEAEIERRWRQFRRAYVKHLSKEGRLAIQIRSTALACIRVLNQCEERGLNPDQGRELIQPLIDPDLDM